MYYIYFLKNQKNNKVYVGFTSKDPLLRVKEHNSGINKFTKQAQSWQLIYYETYSCKKCAKLRERFYKTGIGRQIKKIIINNFRRGMA